MLNQKEDEFDDQRAKQLIRRYIANDGEGLTYEHLFEIYIDIYNVAIDMFDSGLDYSNGI